MSATLAKVPCISMEARRIVSTERTVALYARVSTLDQHCGPQLDDLRRYATQRFGRVYEYIDRGVSGAQRRRPALDALMKDARKRLFDAIIVWKFDRFARSLKHLIDTLDDLCALGVDFISITEAVDTTTPSGQLLFHIVGAVAQFERDLIAERVRAGIAHARTLGKQIGRPRAEVDVVRVAALRREGGSLRQIARKLNIPVSRVRRALVGTIPITGKIVADLRGTNEQTAPP